MLQVPPGDPRKATAGIRGVPAPHTPRHKVLEWRYHTLTWENSVS
jgi:hypothetical protein